MRPNCSGLLLLSTFFVSCWLGSVPSTRVHGRVGKKHCRAMAFTNTAREHGSSIGTHYPVNTGTYMYLEPMAEGSTV